MWAEQGQGAVDMGSLEGDITVPGAPDDSSGGEDYFNTLDEPVRVTVVSFCNNGKDL